MNGTFRAAARFCMEKSRRSEGVRVPRLPFLRGGRKAAVYPPQSWFPLKVGSSQRVVGSEGSSGRVDRTPSNERVGSSRINPVVARCAHRYSASCVNSPHKKGSDTYTEHGLQV